MLRYQQSNAKLCEYCNALLLLCYFLSLACVYSKLSEYGVQRGSDGSVSVSDSVLVKVSGADEDNEKEVLVSWSLRVRNPDESMCSVFCIHFQ